MNWCRYGSAASSVVVVPSGDTDVMTVFPSAAMSERAAGFALALGAASADADAVGSLIGSLRREVEALERDRAAAGDEMARLRRGRTALKGYREATARAPRRRIRDRK